MVTEPNSKPVTENDLDQFEHITTAESAEKVFTWLSTRGGIAIWSSIDFSNLGKTWTTPAMTEHDPPEPYPRPTWQVSTTPKIITDPAKVGVSVDHEIKRFRVGVRRGDQGLNFKVTDGGSRKIRRLVSKAGVGAFYAFDYARQECVIYKPDRIVAIREYMEGGKDGKAARTDSETQTKT